MCGFFQIQIEKQKKGHRLICMSKYLKLYDYPRPNRVKSFPSLNHEFLMQFYGQKKTTKDNTHRIALMTESESLTTCPFELDRRPLRGSCTPV